MPIILIKTYYFHHLGITLKNNWVQNMLKVAQLNLLSPLKRVGQVRITDVQLLHLYLFYERYSLSCIITQKCGSTAEEILSDYVAFSSL